MRSPSVRIVVLLMLGAVATANAQSRRGLEIGMDAAFQHYAYKAEGNSSSPSVNVLSIPLNAARIAFPTDGPFEIEVLGSIQHASSDGGSNTFIGTELGLLMELNHAAPGAQVFARPAVGWLHEGGDNLSSRNQFTIGGGVGFRMILTDRISARYEAKYTYQSKSRDISANVFALLAGISVFTR